MLVSQFLFAFNLIQVYIVYFNESNLDRTGKFIRKLKKRIPLINSPTLISYETGINNQLITDNNSIFLARGSQQPLIEKTGFSVYFATPSPPPFFLFLSFFFFFFIRKNPLDNTTRYNGGGNFSFFIPGTIHFTGIQAPVTTAAWL